MDAGHRLIKEIQKGFRMEKPENAPNVFGEIMTNCWKTDPKERPTFQQLEDTISGYMTNLTEGDPTQKSKKRDFLFRPKFFVVL